MTHGAEQAAAIAAALPAVGTLLAPTARSRAAAMAAALVLAPALLAAEVWDTAAFRPVRDHAAAAVVAAAVGVGALAVAARLLRGRPTALAVAVVLALPFRVPITIGGQTANLLVPLYLAIAAGALAHIAGSLRGPAPRAERRPGPVEWLLAASVAAYALQATYTPDPSHALRNLLFFYVPFAVLYALVAALPWTDRLVAACAAVFGGLALLFAVAGFAEYVTRTVPWNDKLIESNTYNAYFRVNSLFYDPNIYGRFLVIVIVFAAAAVAWSRRRPDALALGGLIAILWGALLTTLSQSSLGAVLVGLGVVVWLRGHTRAVAAGAAVLAIAAAVLVAAAPGSVRLPGGGDDVSLNEATSGRSDLVSTGVDLYGDRPLLGWGSGAFEQEYRRVRHVADAEDLSASHTIPVTVGVEQGTAGLALYVALLVVACATLLRGARRGAVRAAVGAAFVALVFHTLLYAAFLEDPLVWALLAAGVALAARPGADGGAAVAALWRAAAPGRVAGGAPR